MSCQVLFLISLLNIFTYINCSGDLNGYRLYSQADHSLTLITNQAITSAIEVVDNVVEDLLVLDSQNSIILGYLNSFDAFIAVSDNKTEETLDTFYKIVKSYMDDDVAEKTSSIETQLIALCLQRHGFDRWKRTIQLRMGQFQKNLHKKLVKYLDTLDDEERAAVEHRWKHVGLREGASGGQQRRLEKLREFVRWLGKIRDSETDTEI
ncbi:uncharacterized protein LOC6641065 [Drosophila willistoni]|uniref:uncharacterized protein LOC6641065 n=1 Tax=Drosophila willistoni TaxID=7260 RepID=UPI000C26D764|nr:uncharacterized protein LOC6641065 [Drosophila willistoni]